ncbi:MAG TPA: rhomboid family intramembrane serine protease [Vicinamibacterales bacterium]|jgi:membrane associated rhomboid family serine protease|nr:rhomboid family intramembrane serine protease [Vicinamibacterales bacterium]
MIPLSDASRRPLHLPIVATLIIASNIFVFLLEISGGEEFVSQWAVVPAAITAGHNWITLLTAMFLHAGFMHIAGNLVFFWAFAPEIEDVMGHGRFLAFYLFGGLVAFFAQIVVAPGSTVPNVGASGAIAAVMGAFFVTYPGDRIKTLLLLGWFVSVVYVPAWLLVGLWMATQVLSQVGSMASTQPQGGVAYMAHVGGAAFGVLCARLFEARSERQTSTPDW